MMNVPVDLSVVIVTFNSERVIRPCLETLSAAIAPFTTELFIIDNNSQDNTVAILQDAATWKHLSFDYVKGIYNSANLGYTRGVNQGLRLCRGRRVLVLNPDIIFHDHPFSHLMDHLNEKAVGVVSPQFRFPDGNIQPSCRRFPKKLDILFELSGLSRLFPQSRLFNRWRYADFNHRHDRFVDQPQGAFLLTRADVLNKVGALDERFPMFFSDVDWCRRINLAGYKILFCAEHFVTHLKGASVYQKRAEMIVTSHRSFADYFAKYDSSRLQKLITLAIGMLLLAALPLRLLFTKLK